jgi:hypothetical protein
MRLHEQVKEQAAIIDIYKVSIDELRRYMNSEKFSIDIMVNKNDVLLRLDEIQSALFKV